MESTGTDAVKTTQATQTAQQYSLDDLLRFMVKQEASDLHLKPMRPPLLRLKGKLIPLKGEPIKPDAMDRLLRTLLSDKQTEILEDRRCVEFGYSVPGMSRFRGTIYYQRGTLGGVFRRVPFAFPTLDEWGLPDVLKELADLRTGLVLITGPTGSGKSSTLAAVMQQIVQNRLVHVVTIEDPIEFLLTDSLGAVTQREVGSDTTTFADALRNALRQDPDVIMVGENRDLTTMSTTLTAAETGHLVLTTLHTNSAPQTLDRIIDMFPGEQHRQVRQQLSQVLRAVISLQLVERRDGQGLTAAVEVLRESPRVGRLIKEGAIADLGEEIEKSVAFYGMQSMNQSLAALVINNTISKDVAMETSQNPADLDLMLRKFYYAAQQKTDAPGEEAEMPSDADYSRIHKLLEVERLYDELQESFQREITSREERIRDLETSLQERSAGDHGWQARLEEMEQEREKLSKLMETQRADNERKIERLQSRIRELTSDAPPQGGGTKTSGFFRR
jgi:twitching motility protein PilT